MALPMAEKGNWYDGGLRFKCTGCGGCCTGSPGYVWVTPEEISLMANHKKISIDEFSKKYLRLVKGRYSLREHSKTYDCVFLDGKRCTIYEARPTQCRTYPWWISNLSSKEEWEEEGKRCEGINHPDAPLIDLATIQKGLNEDVE